MLTAICLVALTAFDTGEPVIINPHTVAYFQAVGDYRVIVSYSYRTNIALLGTVQEIVDKIQDECGTDQPAS